MKPVVLVEWEDSCSQGVWTRDTEPYTVSACTSVGYLLRKDKQHLTISQSTSGSGQHGHVLVIPIGCVKKVRKLK